MDKLDIVVNTMYGSLLSFQHDLHMGLLMLANMNHTTAILIQYLVIMASIMLTNTIICKIVGSYKNQCFVADTE